MNELFSSDVELREQAGGNYRVFAKRTRIPKRYRADWKLLLGSRDPSDGLRWPRKLRRQARKGQWPKYAFGTANAACLLVMHRPGLERDVDKVEDLNRVLFIKPRFPVLGGIPHAHNALFPVNYLTDNPTWKNIHKYLKPAFKGLRNPWSQLMTCNLNPEHGHTGEVDSAGNVQGLKILDQLVRLCRPKLILLCGGDVHRAIASWDPPRSARVDPPLRRRCT